MGNKIIVSDEKKTTRSNTPIIDNLAKLREPFPQEKISKLPKPTKAQTAEVRTDYTKGIRCNTCGAWHHPKVVHLNYVGHAATTDRLLEVDPLWNWEFMSPVKDGFPVLDADGGMWIYLTVCGVTRKGYGNAPGKSGPDTMKEIIGDAIRNAAMRFGVALDLWSKEDLHSAQPEEDNNSEPEQFFYPDESFQKSLPAWKAAVSDKRKEPNDILTYLANKNVNLTANQIQAIQQLGQEK